MRIGVVSLIFIGFSLGACEAEPEALTPEFKAGLLREVESTLEGLTEAMNSHDPERIFSYFRQSEEFLYLGCTDLLLGWGTFSSRVGPYYVANPEVTFEQGVVRIQILSPTVAVAALRGGSTETDALFWTEVLVKENGAWLITHEHESWPGCPEPSGPHPFTTMEGMTVDTGGPQERETGGS